MVRPYEASSQRSNCTGGPLRHPPGQKEECSSLSKPMKATPSLVTNRSESVAVRLASEKLYRSSHHPHTQKVTTDWTLEMTRLRACHVPKPYTSSLLRSIRMTSLCVSSGANFFGAAILRRHMPHSLPVLRPMRHTGQRTARYTAPTLCLTASVGRHSEQDRRCLSSANETTPGTTYLL